MKVLLINSWRDSIRTPNEPLGLCCLASVLRQHGMDVRIIDMVLDNLEYEDLAKIASHYEVIGISIPVPGCLDEISEFVKKIKRPVNTIIAGGYDPTLNSRQCLEKIDKIDGLVLGEAEMTMLDILGSIHSNKPWQKLPGVYSRERPRRRPLISNLDTLPFPSREYASKILGQNLPLQITSSRGCYGNCNFCSIYAFFSGQAQTPQQMWRYRSAENVVSELRYLKKRFGAEKITFVDDNFIGTHSEGFSRAIRISEMLRGYNLGIRFKITARMDSLPDEVLIPLKNAGLKMVFSGAENANMNVLDYFNKKTTTLQILDTAQRMKALGIDMLLGFIWFTSNMTLEELENNIEFAEKIGIEYIFHPCNSRLRFYPGTRLTLTETDSDFKDARVKETYAIIDEFHKRTNGLYRCLVRARFDSLDESGLQMNMETYRRYKNMEIMILKKAIFNGTVDISDYNKEILEIEAMHKIHKSKN
jgi:anaerobic magnesium-protoporphyrin IX monomethyl ester cyclase